LLTLASVSRAGIIADYSNDGGFFTTNSAAKVAIERAIFDINAVISSSFTAIPAAPRTVVGAAGTNGRTTATFTHSLAYSNPSTGATTTYTGGLAANEIRIFVGARNLTANTLGQGGPGGIGLGISTSSFSSTELTAALASATLQSNTIYGRGGDGPVIGQLSTSIDGNSVLINYGNTIGNLWFDQDTNNNGSADTPLVLNDFWNFDPDATSFGNKADFYSVALHETLHAIGFGTSKTWDDLINNVGDWTGANAIAAAGTGNLLAGAEDFAHIASGILSPRLDGTGLQETLMSPSIVLGTRKKLTELDVAFLRDIGFRTTAVPEPGTILLVSVVFVGGVVARRRRVAA